MSSSNYLAENIFPRLWQFPTWGCHGNKSFYTAKKKKERKKEKSQSFGS